MSAASLGGLLDGKNLVVLVGDGGVGKTSTSAAIACGRAEAGERVAVLTVDPAPRLGDALGVPAIDSRPRTVRLPGSTHGRLVAMRLDSKRTFDRMVEAYSASPQAAARLLEHPIYRALSGSLGGTENYMAFQRLHELVEQGGHDCLVVDTPPAANATDLLAAPERLTGLVETGALQVLAEPARIVARAGGFLARATMELILAALERVTGQSLQARVSEFTGLFSGLVAGLEDRARHIDALLRAPGTAFVLVTRPREGDVASALAFREGLARLGIRVDAVVVNRVTPPRPADEGDADTRLAALPGALRDAVLRMEADVDALRAAERSALAALERGLAGPDAPPVFVVAARDADIASVADIVTLAGELGYREA